MPFNGSGVYSAPSSPGSFNPAVSGQTASPTDWNTLLADIVAGLSTAICKDGQTTITANLPMATFRHTGVGNAVARTDYAAAGQVQDGSLMYVVAGGTADAITLTLAPAVAAYAIGQTFRFKATADNATTTPTVNVNAVGAGTITWPDGTALVAGDIKTGGMYDITVQATTPVFHLKTVNSSPVTLAGTQTVTGNKTFSGNLVATAGTNSFTGTIGSASVGTTQSQADNSTKLATDAYVDRVGVQQVVSTLSGAVATGTTVMPYDDTIPQNTEGDQYMTLAITPKSATSKLVIEILFNFAIDNANEVSLGLFQDTTAGALKAVSSVPPNIGGTTGFSGQITLRHVMTSGTTSATTFKVRAGPGAAGTVTFNGAAAARLFGGVMGSSIIITEIGV